MSLLLIFHPGVQQNNNNNNRVSGCKGWFLNAISNYSVYVFAGTKLRRPKHKCCGKNLRGRFQSRFINL